MKMLSSLAILSIAPCAHAAEVQQPRASRAAGATFSDLRTIVVIGSSRRGGLRIARSGRRRPERDRRSFGAGGDEPIGDTFGGAPIGGMSSLFLGRAPDVLERLLQLVVRVVGVVDVDAGRLAIA